MPMETGPFTPWIEHELDGNICIRCGHQPPTHIVQHIHTKGTIFWEHDSKYSTTNPLKQFERCHAVKH